MCLWCVCKQSDEDHSLHACSFLVVIFQHFFFLVCDDCILKSTTAWLLKLSVLYIHSFMHIHNTTFQIKTIFNNVLFSAEVHNPLHVHLLALSHIYIKECVATKRKDNNAHTISTIDKYAQDNITILCPPTHTHRTETNNIESHWGVTEYQHLPVENMEGTRGQECWC